MSILIREYLGFNDYTMEKYHGISLTEGAAVAQKISPESLMVDIEGLHVGPTRNFTRYMAQGLKGSVPSWTRPYMKPLIMHHNEEDGRIIGRIHHVEYTEHNTLSGTGALIFTVNVPDREGKEQIEDGRLMTVSVGIIGKDVRCSICGHQIAEDGPCDEHMKGQEYDREVCYWDIYEFEGKELSYVIVPSDIYARNIRVYRPDETKSGGSYLKENYEENEVDTVDKEPKDMKKEELLEAYNQLKKELDDLKEEKQQLDTQLQESSSKVSELEAKLEEKGGGEEELQTAQQKLQEAEEKIEDLEGKLQEKEGAVAEEKQLRESAESSLIEEKEKARAEMVERYKLLRKLTNKPELDEEKIKERTEESIKGAVVDLTEELESGSFSIVAGSVDNPGFSSTEEQHSSKKKDDMNLKEELEGLFNHVVSVRRL